MCARARVCVHVCKVLSIPSDATVFIFCHSCKVCVCVRACLCAKVVGNPSDAAIFNVCHSYKVCLCVWCVRVCAYVCVCLL